MAIIARYDTSSAFLSPEHPLRRTPRAPRRKRPPQFFDAFEDRALVYDAFFYAGTETILLIGPPPDGLAPHYETARYRALPSGRQLAPDYFISRSTMITRLGAVPSETVAVEMRFGGQTFTIQVQPDAAPDFKDRRVLFTINKNNKLEWIQAWAHWHAKAHGTDALILIDNGSTDYDLGALEQALASVQGLEKVAVISLPYTFGPIDKTAPAYHFWPRFLQISSTSMVLRRFGMQAQGLINCDIDELMFANASIYELTRQSRLGALRIPGRWIEAAHEGPYPVDHLGFDYRRRGLGAHLSPPKCAIDPSRDWIADLNVHPYLHRIHGAPRGARRLSREAVFFHFRGINTNWKEERAKPEAPDPKRHKLDKKWIAARAHVTKTEKPS